MRRGACALCGSQSGLKTTHWMWLEDSANSPRGWYASGGLSPVSFHLDPEAMPRMLSKCPANSAFTSQGLHLGPKPSRPKPRTFRPEGCAPYVVRVPSQLPYGGSRAGVHHEAVAGRRPSQQQGGLAVHGQSVHAARVLHPPQSRSAPLHTQPGLASAPEDQRQHPLCRVEHPTITCLWVYQWQCIQLGLWSCWPRWTCCQLG